MPRGSVSRIAAGWVLAVGLAGSGQALAAEDPAWQALTPAQQKVLAPLASEWRGMDPARRKKWLEIASRHDRMSEVERARLQERMRDWVRMTPAQRGQARINFREAQRLRPGERQVDWAAYQQLSDDERLELARQVPPAVLIQPNGRSALVGAPSKPISPVAVRAPRGASTKPIAERAQPPFHQQGGLPKIAATPEFVDPATLLPYRGPQGAAVVPERAVRKTATP